MKDTKKNNLYVKQRESAIKRVREGVKNNLDPKYQRIDARLSSIKIMLSTGLNLSARGNKNPDKLVWNALVMLEDLVEDLQNGNNGGGL